MALVLFFFYLFQACLQLAFAHSAVKFLPGFEGPLPFELETGYVGAGDSEDVQLFYYFIKSERKPETDPLILWMSGGPGCSALTAFLLKLGRGVQWKLAYIGIQPILMDKDSPVGTGFSYATNDLAAQTSDLKHVRHLHQFLRKWLMDHPDFNSNPFYVSGDSYSGIPIPVLAHEISNGNEEGIKPIINLQV